MTVLARRVVFSVLHSGDKWVGIGVVDDGLGISKEDRELVFEAGYSTADEGAGFGLNIVREIAKAHGWSIAVTESEQGGARFEVTGIQFAAE